MTRPRDYYYLQLCSDDSKDTYPENTAAEFRVNLPKLLELKGNWECALLDITFWPEVEGTKPDEIYICTNLIANDYAMNSLHPILKRITVPTNIMTKVTVRLPLREFKRVTQSTLQTIHMYIE